MLKRLNARALPERNAVLFDLDGLLIDSERLAMETVRETCQALGYRIEEQTLARVIGQGHESCLALYREAIPDFDEAAFASLEAKVLYERFRSDLQTKPGVGELLDVLSRRGIPYALATSSGAERVRRSLERTGLTSRFSIVISGGDGLASKPAPDLFLAAAKALCVSPAHCLILEDSLNGVRAGHAAGAQVCLVPDLLPYSSAFAPFCDWTAETLLDVAKALEEGSLRFTDPL